MSKKKKLKMKKPPVLHRHILMCCAYSFLQSGGLVCLATPGGLCLHSGGSRRPGVPSLVAFRFVDPTKTVPHETLQGYILDGGGGGWLHYLANGGIQPKEKFITEYRKPEPATLDGLYSNSISTSL